MRKKASRCALLASTLAEEENHLCLLQAGSALRSPPPNGAAGDGWITRLLLPLTKSVAL